MVACTSSVQAEDRKQNYTIEMGGGHECPSLPKELQLIALGEHKPDYVLFFFLRL